MELNQDSSKNIPMATSQYHRPYLGYALILFAGSYLLFAAAGEHASSATDIPFRWLALATLLAADIATLWAIIKSGLHQNIKTLFGTLWAAGASVSFLIILIFTGLSYNPTIAPARQVPKFPEALNWHTESHLGAFGGAGYATYITFAVKNTSSKDIRAFYEKEFNKQGWTIITETPTDVFDENFPIHFLIKKVGSDDTIGSISITAAYSDRVSLDPFNDYSVYISF